LKREREAPAEPNTSFSSASAGGILLIGPPAVADLRSY